mmetsp:Transcript_16882/g.35256  ORF Transcript_16882/g.35256 Transcript_16882/m.35256 type:complete len:90 (+) Transcript_16882:464-733(+)
MSSFGYKLCRNSDDERDRVKGSIGLSDDQLPRQKRALNWLDPDAIEEFRLDTPEGRAAYQGKWRLINTHLKYEFERAQSPEVYPDTDDE